MVITNVPNHYRIPLFNELQRQLSERRMRLKVVFGAGGSGRRLSRVNMSDCAFDYTVLSSRTLPARDFEKTRLTFTGLGEVMARERPSVIISAGFSLATAKLWWWSRFAEIPYIIWSGAVAHPQHPEPFYGRIYRGQLVGRAAGCVAYGSAAKNYLVSLGADPGTVEIAINTVDIRPFLECGGRSPLPAGREGRVRRIVTVGYLYPRKRMDQMLLTVRALAHKRADFTMNIVGDGPEMKNLKAMSESLKLENLVRFDGFRDPGEIPGRLAGAEVFLYSTGFDVWGHVLVEAMATGVPCVASSRSGAARELIREGETGFCVDFAKAEQVAEKVHWLLEHPKEAREIGASGREFVARHLTLEKSAAGFVRAVAKTLGGGRAESSGFTGSER